MSTILKINTSDPRTSLWEAHTLNDSSIWELEKLLDIPKWVSWIDSNPYFGIYCVSIYLSGIVIGKILIRNMQPYKLNVAFNIWNVILSVFSILATWRLVPLYLDTVRQEDGFHKSICTRGPFGHVHTFWILVITLSKIWEFGDTAFLVLRKKPVIFLHWYHHTSVMLYTWMVFSSFDSMLIMFMTMNCFVHSIMYTYFLLKILGIRVPKTISIAITSLQILQMIVGMIAAFYSLYAELIGNGCYVKWSHIIWAIIIYSSYFVLFTNFFVKSYLTPKKSKLN